MKKINRILLFAGVLFAAVGCDKDQINATFTGEGEDAQSAYFAQKTITESFEATATGDKVVYVNLLRQNAESDLTVELQTAMNEATAAFYEIPESASFNAGEYGVKIPVYIHNVENYAPGVTYSAVIGVVNPDHEAVDGIVSIAKNSSVTVSTSLVLNWIPQYTLKDPTKLLANDLTAADYVVGPNGAPLQQTGTYTYTFWWEGDDEGLTLERAEGTSIFRICDWGGGIDLIFTVNPDKKITIDGEEYMTLSVTEQFSGTTNGKGGPEVYISDMFEYTGRDSYFESYPCYWDGERTFVFNLLYYVEEGIFDMPTEEVFVLDDGSASLE